jgi:hypothetical protein
MNLLGAILYDPSSAGTKATSSNIAMTAIDTTNLRLTVTVPAHGYIRVKMSCAIEGGTTFPQILLGVMVGAAISGRIAPQMVINGTALATTRAVAVAEFTIAGLTPGSTVFDAAYGVEFLVASTNIKYGGPNNTTASDAWGGFSYEIWDPRPLTLALDGGVNVSQWKGGTVPATNVTGVPLVDDKYLLGTIYSTPATAGIQDINVKNMNNVAATSITTINANQGTTQPINFTGTGASALAKTDVVDFGGAAGTFASGRPEVNTTHFAGTAATAAAGIPEVKTQSITNNAITAAAINADAITAAKIADGAIDAATFAAGAINAAAIAADAIGASELAADAVTEIQSGLATATNLATVAGYIDTEVAAIKTVTDQITFGTANRVNAQVFGVENNAITAAAIAADAIGASELAADAVTEIQSGLATASALTTVAGYIDTEVASILAAVDTEVAAIKLKTDNLPSDPADASDVAAAITAATSPLATAASLATVAGYIDTEIGTIMTGVADVQTKIGTPAASVSADIAAAKADTAAIKLKTDNLPSDPADASVIAGRFDTIDSEIGLLGDTIGETFVNTNVLREKTDGLVYMYGAIGSTGNSTTQIHLPDVGAYGTNIPNSMLLVIKDVSTDLMYSRWIDGWNTATDIATVDTLPFTPEASTDLYWLVTASRGDLSAPQLSVIADLIPSTQEIWETDLSGLDADPSIASGAVVQVRDQVNDGFAAIPSASVIADAVWDELYDDHLEEGSMGSKVYQTQIDVSGYLPSLYEKLSAMVLVTGTVTGESSTDTQVHIPGLSIEDNEINGQLFMIQNTGTYTRYARRIVDWDADSHFLTLDRALPWTPNGSEPYAILADISPGQIADVQEKTDQLTFTEAGEVDANIQSVNDVEVIGDGESGTEWGPV